MWRKKISSLTITDCEQDQEKTQHLKIFRLSSVSSPPVSADNTKDEINETEEKLSYILDENVEKGISSLTISDCDQEKIQDQCLTCPSGFSDFPPPSADNMRG